MASAYCEYCLTLMRDQGSDAHQFCPIGATILLPVDRLPEFMQTSSLAAFQLRCTHTAYQMISCHG